MIKVFTLNEHGKIELTEKELKELLDEAYWDGYKAHTTITWATPKIVYPYYIQKNYEITCGEQEIMKG